MAKILYVCLFVLASVSLVLGATRGRHQNSAKSKDEWKSCRCNNATHCFQVMTDEGFTKQGAIVGAFPKNYKRAVSLAKQRDPQMEATLSRMMLRFSAVFTQSYKQQLEHAHNVLRRLERLKERQEFDNPQKFMGLARGFSKALMRTHASFSDFVAQHCFQVMTDEGFTKQGAIVGAFPKNYKRAVSLAKQRDPQMEATLSRMMLRFSAVFTQSYKQQLEHAHNVLRRLERLKERQEFDNPQKFMGLARGFSKALMRTHASFSDFVAQVVQEYDLINTNVLQLL